MILLLSLAAPGAAAPRVLAFGDDLHLPGDRVLRGGRAVETVVLPRPAAYALTADPVVHVRFSHAPSLDAAGSTLALMLNDRTVASVPLTAENAENGDLVATLPRDALQDYSRLGVEVVQREGEGCQGPFAPGLWTRLSASSTVELEGEPAALPLQLLDFPAPLWDPLGTGPLRLTPLQAGPMSAGSLEAAGEIAFALGRLADYRGVEIEPAVVAIADATTPAIAIGTPEENPLVASLLGTLTPAPGEGLLALVPDPVHPERAILVVTGSTPEAVRAAARALARDDRATRIAGASARIPVRVDSQPPESRRLPRPMIAEETTLSELGLLDHTSVGLFGAPLVVPLSLEGDARVRPGGAGLSLHYAYGAGLDPRLSTVEVRVDGVGVRSARLDAPDGDEDATLRVPLPGELLEPGSTLEVAFNLYPVGLAECERPVDRQVWATVFADSALRVARDDMARLPDLSLLRYRLFPFSAEGEGERVTIVVGDRAGGPELSAAMQVAAALGARSLASQAPRVLPASAVPGGGMTIVLASGDRPNTALRPDERLPIASADGALVASQPGEAGTARLAIVARDASELLDLARVLGDDAQLHDLGGSRVTWSRDGGLHVAAPAGTTVVRRGSEARQAIAILQEHGSMLAAFAMPGVLAAAMVVRRWARRRGGEA